MEETYTAPQNAQAGFAPADALYATTKDRLSVGELMHADHDEVERFATEQGRRIVQSLLQEHFVLTAVPGCADPGSVI